MNAFYIYTAHSVVVLYGFILFLWWWYKTRSATEVYILMISILLAEAVEKSFYSWISYQLLYTTNINATCEYSVLNNGSLWLLCAPTLIAFTILVLSMTRRLFRTNKALNTGNKLRPIRSVSKKVLVISTSFSTKKFMKEVFTINEVEFIYANDFMSGIELLIEDDEIPVVFFGLNALRESGINSSEAIAMIKKERPWGIIIAITRQPNIFELYESRRSFFDDYIYLPINPEQLMTIYEFSIGKIMRWRKMRFSDRREKSGVVEDRKNIKVRKNTIEEKE